MNLDLRAFQQIVMMRDAITDIWPQHVKNSLDNVTRSRGAIDRQWRRLTAHDPVCRDDVIEITDVVRVQVSEYHARQEGGNDADGREAHHDSTSRIAQHVADPPANQGAGAGAVRVGKRTTCSQQNYLTIAHALRVLATDPSGR